jgi:hypothetical protein
MDAFTKANTIGGTGGKNKGKEDRKAAELDAKLAEHRRKAAVRGRSVLAAAMSPRSTGGAATTSTTGGWVEADAGAGDGSVYYYNEVTGETAWERPAELGGAPAAAVDADPALAVGDTVAALAEGWISTDAGAGDGSVYYYNEVTGETSWEHPGYAAGGEGEGGDLFRSLLATSGTEAEQTAADPYAWVPVEDPASGCTYWHCPGNGQTTWTDPYADPYDAAPSTATWEDPAAPAATGEGAVAATDPAADGAAPQRQRRTSSPPPMSHGGRSMKRAGSVYATAPKIERPGGMPLIELSVEQVQALLRFHRLDNLSASFTEAGVDGAMLNDMTTIEDVDEITPKLRVRKKKLLRVLAAARAEGVSIEDLQQGQFAPIVIEQEEEVTTLADDGDIDAALAMREKAPPAEGNCFVGNIECTRHNVVLPKPGPLGLELCTVLLLRCKRVLVRSSRLVAASVHGVRHPV